MEFSVQWKNSGVKKVRFSTLLTAAAVLMLVTGLSGTAAAKLTSVETVKASTSTFNFEVNPQGGFTGNNNVTFLISRVEEPRGITKRCRQITRVIALHLEPGSPTLASDPDNYGVGRAELNKPLCNFTDLELMGQPFRERDINSVCFETPTHSSPGAQVSTGPPVFLPGKTAVLDKEILLEFILPFGQLAFSRKVPDKILTLRANIRCVDNTVSGRIEPIWGGGEIRQPVRATGTTPSRTTGADYGGRQFTPVDPRTRPKTPTNTTPSRTAGADYGGRQFTPVDPRRPPKVPVNSGSTQPEVTPRDPNTQPRVPASRGSTLPGLIPRDPRTKPGTAGDNTQPAPACNIAGQWKVFENVYWNFNEVDQGKYEVDIENLNDITPELPFGPGASSCIKPTAILSGYTLRFFNCDKNSASFFEGTVDASCNQVSGRRYTSYGHVGPITLIRNMRLRVPTPNP